jgi:hypothetical protein
MNNNSSEKAPLKPSSSFVRGGDHVDLMKRYVDCSSNPYDLRPAADSIIAEAIELRNNTR